MATIKMYKSGHSRYFAGIMRVARQMLQSVPEKRIAAQIEPDGRQPLELARTKTLG